MIDSILSYVTIAAWIILSVSIIVGFVRTTRNHGLRTALAWLVSLRVVVPITAVAALNLVSASLVFIPPQEVGVIISVVSPRGVRDRPVGSGLHWVIPLAEQVQHYPIAWQTYTMSGRATEGQQTGDDSILGRTNDGQEVWLDVSVIFRIKSDEAVRIHIDWQNRYIDEFIRPVTRGLVRTRVSQFTVTEVNSSRRADLELELDQLLRESLNDKGLELDQFILRNITFSDEYAASVEQKQVALENRTESQYQAERIRNLAEGEANATVLAAQAEAQAVRLKAEANAEALRLIGEAIEARPELLTYEYINKISPALQVMLLPNDAPLIFPLPTLPAPLDEAEAEMDEAVDSLITPTPTPVPRE